MLHDFWFNFAAVAVMFIVGTAWLSLMMFLANRDHWSGIYLAFLVLILGISLAVTFADHGRAIHSQKMEQQ